MPSVINAHAALTAEYQSLFGENPTVFEVCDYNASTKLYTLCPVTVGGVIASEQTLVYRDDFEVATENGFRPR